MILLSVDYGDVRTGLAVCDKNEMIASPLPMITEKDAGILAQKIKIQAESYNTEAIVVGLPLNMDGSSGERAEKARSFADMLRNETGLEVFLFDERCTTLSAARELNFTDTRGKKRKKVIDSLSAMLILEGFMTMRKNTAHDKS